MRRTPTRRSPRQAFKNAMGRDPRRVLPWRQQVNTSTPKPLDRGAIFHYWHPDRDGVEHAAKDVAAELTRLGGTDDRGRPVLVAVRPPAGAPVRCRCWLVFMRQPRVTHPISPGWMLLIAWHDGAEPTPKPLAIDNRLYANLYLQSKMSGRAIIGRDFEGKEYFDHCMSVLDKEKNATDRAIEDYKNDRAKDFWDATKIKNIGHGSKFALHHDGTIAPTRQEQNWLRERGNFLPKDVVDRDRDEIKRARGSAMVQKDSVKKWQNDAERELAWSRIREEMKEFARVRVRR